MLRKIDFYGQILLIIVALLAAAAAIFESGYIFLALFLLLPLGIWQLVSAIVFTAKNANNAKTILKIYWLCAGACLIVFFSGFLFRNFADNTVAMMMIGTAMAGSFFTALYYLYLYKKFLLNDTAKENSSIGSV
jgi:hypothetical protein